MSIISRNLTNVKVVRSPSLPSVPDDDDCEDLAVRYEPTEADWESIRGELAAPPAPGEVDLAGWLREQASYYRSLDSELGHGLARELDRLEATIGFLGSPRTWADFEDRRDVQECRIQEDLYHRGREARDN
jgi:hypothetical protein